MVHLITAYVDRSACASPLLCLPLGNGLTRKEKTACVLNVYKCCGQAFGTGVGAKQLPMQQRHVPDERGEVSKIESVKEVYLRRVLSAFLMNCIRTKSGFVWTWMLKSYSPFSHPW